MEIKIDIRGRAARNQAVTEKAAAAAAAEIQGSPHGTRQICVLRCGTVLLQNFTEDLNEPGRQLMLLREPDNRYDRWAIKVCTLTGTLLGYLPSGKNQSVARLMDAGKHIAAFVDDALTIPPPFPGRPGSENAGLPLALYMDIPAAKENAK